MVPVPGPRRYHDALAHSYDTMMNKDCILCKGTHIAVHHPCSSPSSSWPTSARMRSLSHCSCTRSAGCSGTCSWKKGQWSSHKPETCLPEASIVESHFPETFSAEFSLPDVDFRSSPASEEELTAFAILNPRLRRTSVPAHNT